MIKDVVNFGIGFGGIQFIPTLGFLSRPVNAVDIISVPAPKSTSWVPEAKSASWSPAPKATSWCPGKE